MARVSWSIAPAVFETLSVCWVVPDAICWMGSLVLVECGSSLVLFLELGPAGAPSNRVHRAGRQAFEELADLIDGCIQLRERFIQAAKLLARLAQLAFQAGAGLLLA